MKNFNLLISSPRYNETNAKAELWFTLLLCEDKYPIISDLEFQGLITALTSVNELQIIERIKEILTKDPFFYKYILKIIPIQFICKTDIRLIIKIIENNFQHYINDNQTFRIKLKRRKNKLIKREGFIHTITKNINNPVDLENPDKTIRIEMLDNVCGISFLNQGDVIKPSNKFLKVTQT